MNDAAVPECRRVVAHGLVQGVGFRHACVQQARRLGLTGWVRNRRGGSVEALLQGAPAQIERMCDWMRDGADNPGRVDGLDISVVEPPYARHDRFEQAPTA